MVVTSSGATYVSRGTAAESHHGVQVLLLALQGEAHGREEPVDQLLVSIYNVPACGVADGPVPDLHGCV